MIVTKLIEDFSGKLMKKDLKKGGTCDFFITLESYVLFSFRR